MRVRFRMAVGRVAGVQSGRPFGGRIVSEPTTPMPDWTPDERAAILAQGKEEFTVERLIEYIEDDDERFPAEQVLAELEEMARPVELRGQEVRR